MFGLRILSAPARRAVGQIGDGQDCAWCRWGRLEIWKQVAIGRV